MQLYARDYGEGVPLLILHGLLGASGNWHTLSSRVFGAQFHVYAIDLRNHGRSPHDDAFDYPLMVADLVAFMEAHEIDTAHVLGHSMGGKVAMHLALDHPGRVDRLIVADMAPKAYPRHHEAIFDALRALDLAAFDGRGAIDTALAEHIPSVAVRQFLLKNLAADGEGGYTWRMNLEGIYRNYDRLNGAVAATQPFEGPALFVRGGASNYVTDADEAEILRLFPHAEFAMIPGAGHWVHAEAPEPFAAAVMAFLTA